jgi:hypothetical protein
MSIAFKEIPGPRQSLTVGKNEIAKQNGDLMNAKLLAILAIIIVFMFCSAGTAFGQYTDNMGGTWNNPTSASIGNIINDRIWNRLRAKARARKNGSTTSSQTTQEPAVSEKTPAQIDAAVRFRSTGTQLKTQAITDALGAGSTPEAKKQMFDMLSLLLTEYEKAARAKGKPNDLALALTAALVYNSSIYNGTPEPDDARIMEIRDALAELAIEAGTFASITDRQKQEIYETAVISTMLAKAGYEAAKEAGDKNTMAIYRGLAGQTLQAISGMPPEKVNLTNPPPSNGVADGADTSALNVAVDYYTILKAYNDNRVGGEAKYNGKRVTIVGPMDFVLVEDGKPKIRMSVPAGPGLQMFLVFPLSQKPQLAPLIAGQKIVAECTMLGVVGGLDNVGRLTLDRCVLK